MNNLHKLFHAINNNSKKLKAHKKIKIFLKKFKFFFKTKTTIKIHYAVNLFRLLTFKVVHFIIQYV